MYSSRCNLGLSIHIYRWSLFCLIQVIDKFPTQLWILSPAAKIGSYCHPGVPPILSLYWMPCFKWSLIIERWIKISLDWFAIPLLFMFRFFQVQSSDADDASALNRIFALRAVNRESRPRTYHPLPRPLWTLCNQHLLFIDSGQSAHWTEWSVLRHGCSGNVSSSLDPVLLKPYWPLQ